jgi:hypothetical protein
MVAFPKEKLSERREICHAKTRRKMVKAFETELKELCGTLWKALYTRNGRFTGATSHQGQRYYPHEFLIL